MKRRVAVLLLILAFSIFSALSGCARAAGGKNAPGKKSSNDGLLECNWVLKVDKTIPVKYKDGVTVDHTLVFIAVKEGGTDVLGTYHGAFCLRSTLDISKYSNEAVEMKGGFDAYGFGNDVTFEVVSYDIDKYAKYGREEQEITIPHLVKFESMATFTHEVTGAGILNPYVKAKNPEVEESVSVSSGGSASIPIKIGIMSGKVFIDFPTLNIGQSFEGLVLGEPLGDNSEYDDTMEKIEEMAREAEEGGSIGSGEEGGELGGLGDLGGFGEFMGEMGTNLSIPDSFPADDIPVLPGANVINVYENNSKLNVRITYGTSKSYDEVVKFYEDEFFSKLEKKPQPMDMDDGVMYMFDKEGYNRISIIIMRDTSKTYSSIVTLDVSKKK